MSAGIAYTSVTLGEGEHTTAILKALRPALRRVLVPAGTESETLVLLHAVSEAGPTFLMRDLNRTPIKLFFEAGDAVEIDPNMFGPLTYAALGARDSNGEMVVPQTADRVFSLGWGEA